MNQVQLVGRLGNDPKTNAKGTVCNLSVATNSRAQVDGEWTTTTDWHRVVVFGKKGENCTKFLTKGSEVAVTGRIKYGQYEKDGATVYTTDIIAHDVEFIGPKSDTTSAPAAQVDEEEFPF